MVAVSLIAVRRTGPFLLPARIVFVFSGALAIAMGLAHLFDEVQRTEVDAFYAVLAVIASQVWLFSLIFGWRGNRLALTFAGGLAFAEFGIQASTHFAIGVNAIEFLLPTRGLGLAVNLMLLEVACALCFVTAIICASNPFGASRRLESFPLLLAALAGVSALILSSADAASRHGFGTLNVEDGLLLTVIAATLWIIGSLWMAGAPRLGALVVIVATASVVIPFVPLHLVNGGTSMQQLADKGGLGAAIVAAAAFVLAGASLVVSVGLLVRSAIPRKRASAPPATQPVRRGA